MMTMSKARLLDRERGRITGRCEAVPVVFPFATATSICRSRLTICSGVCFFPRAIPGSAHTSLSHIRWYKICRAGQLEEAYNRHEWYVHSCVSQPDLLTLADEPRYKALVKKIAFPARVQLAEQTTP